MHMKLSIVNIAFGLGEQTPVPGWYWPVGQAIQDSCCELWEGVYTVGKYISYVLSCSSYVGVMIYI